MIHAVVNVLINCFRQQTSLTIWTAKGFHSGHPFLSCIFFSSPANMKFKLWKVLRAEGAIYAPMIYTAPCVMLLMRADPLRGQVGGGWALEIWSFLGPVKCHRADRRVPFGVESWMYQYLQVNCLGKRIWIQGAAVECLTYVNSVFFNSADNANESVQWKQLKGFSLERNHTRTCR